MWNLNNAIGADGIAGPTKIAGKVINASAGNVTVDWTGFVDATGTTITLAGSTATTLRPEGLRYLMIQPRGGAAEVRIGSMTSGVVIADGDRYTIPALTMPSIVLVSGPTTVYLEAGL
jgi:hypothetical protein